MGKGKYLQGETIGNRDSILYIRCKDEAGNNFIVEMQVSKQLHFFKRALLYLSMSIAASAKKGEGYDFNYPNIYSLNFLDFDMNSGGSTEDIVQYVSLSDDNHPEIRFDCARAYRSGFFIPFAMRMSTASSRGTR
uniref:Uncharacterized protein n=1 Tax=uncultured bacterium contig00016 TaxID=1181507 RepID=A0A806KJ40_9BACT|nr:hypothetical protein [uncultured bacterium contig00016]